MAAQRRVDGNLHGGRSQLGATQDLGTSAALELLAQAAAGGLRVVCEHDEGNARAEGGEEISALGDRLVDEHHRRRLAGEPLPHGLGGDRVRVKLARCQLGESRGDAGCVAGRDTEEAHVDLGCVRIDGRRRARRVVRSRSRTRDAEATGARLTSGPDLSDGLTHQSPS